MGSQLSGPERMLLTDHAAFVVSGVEPGADVEMDFRCDYGKPIGVWQSRAAFRADGGGRVDAAADRPTGGSWSDPDPYGAWWSMERTDEPSTTTLPYSLVATKVTATLSDGTVLLHESIRARWRRSVTVDETAIGPLPTRIARPIDADATNTGVVVLGGSDGGFPALDWLGPLASHRAVAVSLGSFRLPGLRDELIDIDIEPVAATIRNVQAHFGLEHMILVGLSRGSELAFLCAAHQPESACCAVGYVPSGVVNVGLIATGGGDRSAWRIGGESLPTWQWTQEGAIDPEDPSVIAVERIHGHVVTFVAGQDRLWPSQRLTAPIVARRLRAGVAARAGDLHRVYEAAGHTFGGYPGLPVPDPSTPTIHPVTRQSMTMGGTRLGNAAAKADSWHQLTALIDRHVSGAVAHDD